SGSAPRRSPARCWSPRTWRTRCGRGSGAGRGRTRGRGSPRRRAGAATGGRWWAWGWWRPWRTAVPGTSRLPWRRPGPAGAGRREQRRVVPGGHGEVGEHGAHGVLVRAGFLDAARHQRELGGVAELALPREEVEVEVADLLGGLLVDHGEVAHVLVPRVEVV